MTLHLKSYANRILSLGLGVFIIFLSDSVSGDKKYICIFVQLCFYKSGSKLKVAFIYVCDISD